MEIAAASGMQLDATYGIEMRAMPMLVDTTLMGDCPGVLFQYVEYHR